MGIGNMIRSAKLHIRRKQRQREIRIEAKQDDAKYRLKQLRKEEEYRHTLRKIAKKKSAIRSLKSNPIENIKKRFNTSDEVKPNPFSLGGSSEKKESKSPFDLGGN